jgi:lysylphosphatidylglycerol synthetase-like protein (DUF2156 family)
MFNIAKDTFMIIGLILIALYIILNIILGIVLNSLNKTMYGKNSIIAWIPLVNLYLLGKLTVNKIIGWLLVIGFILTFETTFTTYDGSTATESLISILPTGISDKISIILNLTIIVLFIYAIIKLVKLKKNNSVQKQQATAFNQDNIIQSTVEKQVIEYNLNTIDENKND